MFETLLHHSLFETLAQGGWVMIPILTCSLISLAVIIEKLCWGPTRGRVIPPDLVRDAEELIELGRYDELLGRCRADQSPLANVLTAMLSRLDAPREEIVAAMELAGKRDSLKMQRRLSALGSIAAVGPLLGLLGTISGMITTFAAISQHGAGNPAMLASGISEALVSTASGLSVAIPSLLFHRYFLHNGRSLIVELETVALDLFDRIRTRERDGAQLSGTPAPSGSPSPLRSSDVRGADLRGTEAGTRLGSGIRTR